MGLCRLWLIIRRFRWVYCQLEVIKKCRRPKQLYQALASLPKTLDETYDRLIETIVKEDEQLDAVRVLGWLCYAKRPLTLSEIVEVLAVTPGCNGELQPQERLVEPYDLIAICTSLITVVKINRNGKETTLVRLAHYSVQEYLLSRCKLGDFDCESSNLGIAETCMQYLLYACRLPKSISWNLDTNGELPLYSYSASQWFYHARAAGPRINESLVRVALKDLFGQRDAFEAWARMFNASTIIKKNAAELSPLHYAAFVGILAIVEAHINEGANPNDVHYVPIDFSQTNVRCTPLDVAALEGHHDIVQLLLDAGANPNIADGELGTALVAASSSGHQAIVELLLQHGADPNICGHGHDGLPLQAAAHSGHESIVTLLLASGADPDQQGGEMGSALNTAAYRGNEIIVRLLLEAGANPNLHTSRGNALLAAADTGRENIVRLLLERGVDVNQVTNDPQEHATALQAAAYEAHEGVVRLLVDNGADINAAPGSKGNALHIAWGRGNHRVVDFLTARGAVRTPPRPQRPQRPPSVDLNVDGQGLPVTAPPNMI